ncbi:PKD domain-containing protein, partial [Maribellus sp. YY47]|uniref:PKD domain-containing protein n=1 Tax=Maribellus sp. YY47 TaxID=2929486 RepID=UPI00200139B6
GLGNAVVDFDASGSTAGTNGMPIATYGWDWDNNGSIDETTVSAMASHSFAVGTHTVDVTVTDEFGCYNSTTTQFTVYDNPVADLDADPECEVDGSAEIDFDASGSTAGTNGMPIATYGWDWDNNGSIDETTVIATASHIFSVGTHTIGLTVTDEFGCYNSTTIQITVYEEPDCDITVDANSTNYDNNNGALTITITTTNVDIVNRTYEWYLPGAVIPVGLPADEDAITPGIQVTGLSDGEYCLVVKEDHGGGVICQHECCATIDWIPQAPSCRVVPHEPLCFGTNTGSMDIYVKGIGDFMIQLDTLDASTTPPTLTTVWGPQQVAKGGSGDDFETMVNVPNLYAGVYQATIVDLGNSLIASRETYCGDEILQPEELTCSTVGHNSSCDVADGWAEFTVSGGTAPIYVSVDGGPFVDVTTLTWDVGGYYVISGLSGSDAGTLHTINVKDANECPSDCDVMIYSDQCDVCNTAYAYGGDDISKSFLTECNEGGMWSNWGWSFAITEPGEYKFPMYAGAPTCDPSPVWDSHLVDSVLVIFDGTHITVDYLELYDYTLDQTHIWVATGSEWFPDKIAPGQWDYAEGDNIPFTGGYIVIHAVYCGDPLPPVVEIKSSSTQNVTLSQSSLKVYPNPFTEKVTFEFVSGVDAYGVLEIYNITGQRVARILDRQVLSGEMNRIEYQPTNDATGIYLYKLDLDGRTQIGRIIYRE